MKKRSSIILIVVTILILVSFRLMWLSTFSDGDQPEIHNGELDLRQYEGGIEKVNLDGEWNFYPNQWLIEDNDTDNGKPIEVPGGWNRFFQEESEPSFGYGSYHLRIFVDPSDESTYSLRVASIRSASELYVNDRYLGGSGKVGENKATYEAWNMPFTATFVPDDGLIDIVIQVANFKDVRDGGLVRTIKLGKESVIAKETELSIMLQQMVIIVFLIHAIYSIILFFMGNRDKVLLHFSLLMTGMLFIHLFGSEDKVLHNWLPVSYDWGFKLVYMSIIIITITLLNLIRIEVKRLGKKIVKMLTYISYLILLVTVFLPITILTKLYIPYNGLALLVVIITVIYFPRRSIKEPVEEVLLSISLVAIVNQFFWMFYFIQTGIKVMSYPFDIMIALFCFASIWFRRSSRAHLQAEQLATKLQKEDELKDEFLANTSHELRNPLHGILNMLSAVLDQKQTTLHEQDKQHIRTALQMGRHMSFTLNDLLDMIHLKEGKPRLNLTEVNLLPIITGLVDMLQFMVEGKSVRIINKVASNLPKVYADENRVIQVIFNLLHNAVNYTDEGEICIDATIEESDIRIIVSDTGAGMDSETLEKIFEPYERGELVNGRAVKSGVGIGLTISKQLVELQGGVLEASSILKEGSEFAFTLPIASGETGQTSHYVSSEQVFTNSLVTEENEYIRKDDLQANNLPKILVVDDESINLQVIDTILMAKYYHIVSVTSGEEALQLVNSHRWDLVISDVMMPEMSGYQLTRAIRKSYSVTELPILLLTARSQSSDIKAGFSAGANDYVTKPVEPVELRSRVELLINMKQSIYQQLKMEGAWLQAQIQPHFLFNTLNSITALSEIDLDRMRLVIDEFAKFLRSKFQFEMIDELHPIEDELNIVRSYLFIEQIRFTDRLHVEWDLDDYNNIYIPLLTIQPLVENAIQHGLMTCYEGGTITISITRSNLGVTVSVIDDGAGMDEETVESVLNKNTNRDSGVGLINTHLRLARHFGDGITIESERGRGTTVSFDVIKEA